MIARRRSLAATIGWLLLGLLAVLGVFLLWPLAPLGAVPRPSPARTPDEARARFAAMLARDTAPLHRGCAGVMLEHGGRTGRVVVLLHGLTNCPLQFQELGLRLYTAGDNVLIPRCPHHGLDDRMTTDLARLTAEELAAYATGAVDLACGLGDTIVIAGLSTSAVAVAWAAEHRPEVARAVLIAPAFAPYRAQRPGAWLATRLLMRMPNVFAWWDGRLKQNLPGPTQCYPRFSTRALGEAYRLGEIVRAAATRVPATAREIVIVTSAADHAVENRFSRALADDWRARGSVVSEYEFPESLHVVHDMIDPVQVGQRIDVTYPVLVALMRAPLAASVSASPGAAPAARTP